MKNENTKKLICVKCQRDLQLGMDVIQLQEGVIGLRGFVRLEDAVLYCSEQCVKDNFTDSMYTPQRVP